MWLFVCSIKKCQYFGSILRYHFSTECWCMRTLFTFLSFPGTYPTQALSLLRCPCRMDLVRFLVEIAVIFRFRSPFCGSCFLSHRRNRPLCNPLLDKLCNPCLSVCRFSKQSDPFFFFKSVTQPTIFIVDRFPYCLCLLSLVRHILLHDFYLLRERERENGHPLQPVR